MTGGKAVSIVVPVYADWPSLRVCLTSLIKHVDTSKHEIILVNDCGPEADLMESKIKELLAGHQGFEYFRNPKNLGFLGTCNLAVLELDKSGNDIMLLNSDAEVTAGFIEEMVNVLYSSPKFGAISPRSNNATLATIPLYAAPQKGIAAKDSYAIYQKLKPKLPRHSLAPVAHGFCMLIRRQLIDKYGLFDEVFGKGYGEEVDFCMRIKAKGFLSIVSNWSYVYHLEARSFTPEVKAKLIDEHNQIVWKRYPSYRQQVRDYMEQAVAEENQILEKLRLAPETGGIKAKIKRHPKLYKLAQRLRRVWS